MTLDQARRLRLLKRWHRRVAVIVALWLAALAMSGSAINRAHDWGLDRAALPGALQRALYGIEAAGEEPCAGLDPAPAACAQAFARLDGAAGSILLTPHSAIVLDPDGRLVEALPAGQLGLARIDAGLAAGERFYLRGDGRVVAGDAGLLELYEPDAAEQATLEGRAWRQRGAVPSEITWERLLLDVHAARFLGPVAPWFTDAMAAAILLLVFSGAWLSRVRNRNGER
jgi:hypothetical protein